MIEEIVKVQEEIFSMSDHAALVNSDVTAVTVDDSVEKWP
jgi:hypothetical protein